jgi:PEGA domain
VFAHFGAAFCILTPQQGPMKRTQLITLVLVLFTGIGLANAKPKIAVLGLEVLDKTNAKPSLDAARQVTEGLRLGAKGPTGPFELAENSQREFLDEKIINQCETEQRECLNKIAGNFGANALMYGKLELTDTKKSYRLMIWLLTVDKNTTKTTSTTVPITSSAVELQNAGKKMYGDLVGITNLGSIAIKAKASKGIVYLNGDMRGQLVDGEYKATQLADGDYRVRIVADGFKKWEETVRVKSGLATAVEPTLEAEEVAGPVQKPPVADEPEDKASRAIARGPGDLESRENTVSRGRGRRGWKIAAMGGAAVAAGGLALVGYHYVARGKDLDKITVTYVAGGSGFWASECSDDKLTANDEANYNKACDHTKGMWLGGTIAGVAGAFAAFAIYQGFIAEDESRPATGSSRTRKQRFAVTPMVSPEGGGATFRIDF